MLLFFLGTSAHKGSPHVRCVFEGSLFEVGLEGKSMGGHSFLRFLYFETLSLQVLVGFSLVGGSCFTVRTDAKVQRLQDRANKLVDGRSKSLR